MESEQRWAQGRTFLGRGKGQSQMHTEQSVEELGDPWTSGSFSGALVWYNGWVGRLPGNWKFGRFAIREKSREFNNDDWGEKSF